MEERKEFPKTVKEFYDELLGFNILNDMKITIEAVEKLYKFLTHPKKDNYLAIYASVKFSNDEDEQERKIAHRVYGTCPNCGNGLSFTRGKCLSQKMSVYENGTYCLNCGKIYGREGLSKIYVKKEEPIFHKTTLKS